MTGGPLGEAGPGRSGARAGPPTVPRTPLPRTSLRALGDLGGLGPALVFIVLFSFLPLSALVVEAWSSQGGATGLVSVLFDPGIVGQLVRQGLVNSLVQGLLSAALAFGWGLPVGVLLGRLRFRGRGFLLAFLLVPFLLPALVVVLGVQELFNPGGPGTSAGFLSAVWAPAGSLGTGLPAILTVNVFYNTSMVALFTVAGTTQSSPSLEDAVATLGGSPWRGFRDVWGRPALLGASAGALLTFLFSFLSFAPPLVLGGERTYTVEDWIYAFFHLRPGVPLGLSLGLSLWTMLLLLLPSLLYLLLARRVQLFSPSSGASSSGRRTIFWGSLRPFRPSWDLPFVAFTAALVGFVGLLLGAVIVGSCLTFPMGGSPWGHLGLEDWQFLFSDRATQALGGTSTVEAIGNTLFFASASTLLLLLVGLTAGFSRLRHPRAGMWTDLLSFVPLLSSPVILALALWSFYGDTLYTPTLLWVLILGAQAGLALPFVLQTVSTAFRANSPAGREAAQLLGASRWRAFLDVDVPATRGALLASSLFSFALSLGEFTATNFLYTPPYTTLVVEMYFLTGGRLLGAVGAAAAQALGGLLVLVSLASFLVILEVGRRAGNR